MASSRPSQVMLLALTVGMLLTSLVLQAQADVDEGTCTCAATVESPTCAVTATSCDDSYTATCTTLPPQIFPPLCACACVESTSLVGGRANHKPPQYIRQPAM